MAIVTETIGDAPYAPLRERLARLCGVVVAVIAQVVMRDRTVVGSHYLAPVIETALGVVLVLGDGVLKAAALPRLPLRLDHQPHCLLATDTMPLTRTAKMLMAWVSAVSLATFAVVLARAVNILT